jgi:N-methylhydantoinase B
VTRSPDGLVDEPGTEARRANLLRARLAAALPPTHPIAGIAADAPGLPLYIGIEQRGGLAVATASGAILARAPAHWTDGCPVLTTALGPHAEISAYLDPITGKTLLVDVVPKGEPRAIASLPRRWTMAGQTAVPAIGSPVHA